MSFTEITLILFVALVLFGPEDLPVIARTLGKVVFQIRKYANELTKDFKEAIDTPGTILNEALNEPQKNTKTMPKEQNKVQEKDDSSEELLSYEEPDKKNDEINDNAGESNPLLDLPQEIVSHPNDKQAGD